MTYSVTVERTPIACANCGSSDVSQVAENVTERTADEVEVAFLDVFSRCGKCGNEFYTKEQSIAHSTALANAVRGKLGFYSPAKIREIRERLGLTQVQFERALGVGKKTVVRWERGTVPHNQAVDGLIWIADHYPSIFARLAERRGVVSQMKAMNVATVLSAAGIPVEKPRRIERPLAFRFQATSSAEADLWALESAV